MENLKELSFEEMVEIDGGKKFWDTFAGKLVFATCAAIIANFVRMGFDEIFN